MKRLGDGIRNVMAQLGEEGASVSRAHRVAEVHYRWKTACEAVYGSAARLVLSHVNAVYVLSAKDVKGPIKTPVAAGETVVVVYSDDSLIRSDLDARQEFLKMKLNELGEHAGALEVRQSRFDMKDRHPFSKEETGGANEDLYVREEREPSLKPERVSELEAMAGEVDNAAVKEAILEAVRASGEGEKSKKR